MKKETTEQPKLASLAAALVKFQAMAPSIEKNQTATIPTKTGSGYSYKYADLKDIRDKIKEPLEKCGLAVVQIPMAVGERYGLKTLIMHEGGESIEEVMPLPVSREARAQDVGAAITYIRRYMLTSMLGLVTEDDTDAQNIPDNRKASPKQLVELKRAAYQNGQGISERWAFDELIRSLTGKEPRNLMANEIDDLIAEINNSVISQEASEVIIKPALSQQ